MVKPGHRIRKNLSEGQKVAIICPNSQIFHKIDRKSRTSCHTITTVLIVEQNVKQTLLVANRGYVLETGRITNQGTGKSLLNDEHVKTAYLGI